MNEADRLMLNTLKKSLAEIKEHNHMHTIALDLISIIERQSKALEKCKEQRDKMLSDATHLYLARQHWNKELAQILEGKS